MLKSKQIIYDCIIVLAHEMTKNGDLKEESVSRIKYACKLHEFNKKSHLITLGWDYRKDSTDFIAHRMKEFAINQGIPCHKISAEINSRDTVGDAFFSKINHVEKHNFKNIIVITSSYHVNRTKEIFKFVYGEKFNIKVKGVTADNVKAKINKEKKSLLTFKRMFSDVESGNNEKIFERLKKSHPFYNGKIYPSI